LDLAGAALTRPLSMGPFHFSAFGLCSGAGLLAAFALMRRTATPAALDPERLQDAALFAAMAAFVLSRVLLIATDPHAFRTYPLLLLGLPSLTYGGIVLTAAAAFGYLRFKHLSVLKVLDAWSPPAALLVAALSLGHFLEASDPGMPSQLPWALHMPGWHVRLQPVQLYSTFAAFVLTAVLLSQLKKAHAAGTVFRTALLLGGLTAYTLQMLMQPNTFQPDVLLEPGQWISLAAVTVGLLLYLSPILSHIQARNEPPQHAAQTLKESL
jgi:phosphatidylglycerol:prolipoprotein diacylglycerol transferase